MIRKHTALSILPIASALTEQNVVVSPKPSTVISELFKWSMGTMVPTASAESHELETIVSNSDLVVDEGMSGHSAVIDSEVTNTSKVLAHQLKYTKDVAKVLLDSTFESITANVNAYSETDIDICEVTIPEVYLTDSFASLMENYKDLDYKAVRCAPVTINETPSEEVLMEAIRTGSVGFDTLVLKVLQSKSEGWLTKVFNDNFTGRWAGPSDWYEKTDSAVQVYKPDLKYLDETLAVFLLSVGFEETPLPGFKGSMLEYRAALAGLARATAVSMVLMVSEFNRQVALGRLIVNTPDINYLRYSARGVVHVSAKHYKDFLDQGGTPEAIIGAALTTQGRPYDLQAIMDRSVELVSTYRRSCTDRDQRAQATLMESFGNEATNFFHEFLHNTAKFDYPSIAEYDQENTGYHNLVNEVFSNILPKRWAEEPYLALREMFANILWVGTNTESLLTVIDREMNRHSDLEPREAAYRATIDILLDHYLGQVDVERLKV